MSSFLSFLLSFLSYTSSSINYLLHLSFTVSLPVSTIFLFSALCAAAVFVLIRYRFHVGYKKLPPLPANEKPKGPSYDLHPDTVNSHNDPEYKPYPDEFLSAFLSSIKVFGYLEQPVFHELARHLQTRKLLQGDTLFDSEEQERSFYIVVDGCVQVFVKKTAANNHLSTENLAAPPQWDADPDATPADPFAGHTLLNEVRAGGTLSSLFSILSLFTEDVSLRHEDEPLLDFKHVDPPPREFSSPPLGRNKMKFRKTTFAAPRQATTLSTFSTLPKDDQSPTSPHSPRTSSSRSSSFSSPIADADTDVAVHRVPSDGVQKTAPDVETHRPVEREELEEQLSSNFGAFKTPSIASSSVFPCLESSDSEEPSYFRPTKRASQSQARPVYRSEPRSKPSVESRNPSKPSNTVHADIIARATVDTTLMVIPAEAFHKLTEKFPNSAAHIVQVILARFQRVTFLTLYRYLGLTNELLKIEKTVNDLATYNLPADFFDNGGLERLRQKFIGNRRNYAGTSSSTVAGVTGNAKLEITVDTDLTKMVSAKRYPNLSPRPATATSTPSDFKLKPLPSASQKSKSFTNIGAPTLEVSPAADTDDPKEVSRPVPHPPAMFNAPSPASYRRHNRTGSGVSGMVTDSEGIEEDMRMRDAVFECISRSIGLVQTVPESDGNGLHPGSAVPLSAADSNLDSPARVPSASTPFPSNDLFAHMIQQRALLGGVGTGATTFASSTHHGNGSPLDLENASNASTSSSMVSVCNSEVDNEVEIRYFEKGTYLIKERERHVGLYFVIDGLLDVSIGEIEKTENEAADAPSSQLHPPASAHPTQTHGLRNLASRNLASARLGKKSSPSAKMFSESRGTSSGNFSSSSRSETLSSSKNSNAKSVCFIKPGGLAGYLAAMTGYPSFVNIRAATDTYVGFLSKRALERIVERHPMVLMTLAKRLITQLSPLVLHIDFALEWVQANAGQVLYRQNDPSDSIYIVLNGRLRTISERNDDPNSFEILGEHGKGESVGELEVLTDSPRPSTLHAIRDTEIAKMPKTLFNALALRHPQITIQISRIIALRSRQQNLINTGSGPILSSRSSPSTTGLNNNNANLKTIGIIPINAAIPITEFASRLKEALVGIGATVSLLNQTVVMEGMGKHAFSKMGKLKLNNWLSEQEERVRIVLYVADGGVSSVWTQKCVRQADAIFLVGHGDGNPSIGEFERLIVGMKTTARKELVLLHSERYCVSGSTHKWLKNRLWIHAHHHVHMPLKMPSVLREDSRKNAFSNIIEHFQGSIQRFQSARFGMTKPSSSYVYQGNRSDFARLARRICGKSVGLVLGGGGARGLAHIGVIRALEEAGIPVDMIGGTSIGSLIGSLYARESDNLSIMGRAKQFSARMSSKWRQALDLTYPSASWFTGHEFNRTIWKCLGGHMIEDFWLPYFCVTTNITWSRLEVHQSGYAWRYVRASMSLSGYLPPLCENGHMLVDGGYVDNLPVGVMRSMGADTIFAVDVASEDDNSPVDYGDTLSGWWVVLNRFNPFSTVKIPTLADIQSRLAYVSSVKQLEEAKALVGCLYLKPPVQMYGTLDFNRFQEIMQKGYVYGKEMLTRLRNEGRLEKCFGLVEGVSDGIDVQRKKQGLRGRRNSI